MVFVMKFKNVRRVHANVYHIACVGVGPLFKSLRFSSTDPLFTASQIIYPYCWLLLNSFTTDLLVDHKVKNPLLKILKSSQRYLAGNKQTASSDLPDSNLDFESVLLHGISTMICSSSDQTLSGSNL